MTQAMTIRLEGKPPAEMLAVQEAIARCYQCGTCSATCPAAFAMDYSPRALWRLVELGQKDELFRSNTFWICASCYACTVRCPQGIQITDVMTQLRNLALTQGYKARKGRVYNQGFMDIVRRHGRMYEPELVVRYNLLTNPLNLVSLAPVGLKMILKRKLRLLPDHPPGRSEIRRLFDHLEETARRKEQEG